MYELGNHEGHEEFKGKPVSASRGRLRRLHVLHGEVLFPLLRETRYTYADTPISR